MGMNLDPPVVKDLTILIATSALGGLAMASLGQPTINGYFIAGSLVGPGGLKLIKEIVQVGGWGARWGGWRARQVAGAVLGAAAWCMHASA